ATIDISQNGAPLDCMYTAQAIVHIQQLLSIIITEMLESNINIKASSISQEKMTVKLNILYGVWQVDCTYPAF
ncbi:MAG: hypothetical protein RBS96_08925, partial [Dehalococcoidales bacterium]|nr:hypothetical protein [Dehalococcoidales bacterium]